MLINQIRDILKKKINNNNSEIYFEGKSRIELHKVSYVIVFI